MRDEVFRSGHALYIEDEPYWLLRDVMEKRGYGYLVKRDTNLTVTHVSPNNRERVWSLAVGEERPRAAWAVNAAGRSELHDRYPKRTLPRRRRVHARVTGSDCSPPRRPIPGFNQRPTELDTP
ncbi:hypothetical protein [Streptomyces sp. NPDC005143]